MRKLVLALLLVMAALAAVHARAAAGQDAFDFGDMPPLPPPLVDDAPAPPPLAVPGTPSMSPLAPLAPPGLTPPPAATPSAPATATRPTTTQPLAPPMAPPLAPPPLSPDAGPEVRPVDLPGQVGAPAQAAAAAPPAEEKPRQAKISGGRVNVRAGPNTQYESIDVLTTGAPVTVLAKNGDWYKIVFPADKLASIHKNYVNADITGEIPEAGVPGIVNQDNADVHAFYWDKSTVVGKLNKGDPVTIKQERGQWYRIAAPASARAYVFAQYVRVDGNEQIAMDSAPPPENPSIDLAQGKPDATGRLKLSDNDRRANEIKEAYFKRLQENHRRAQEEQATQVNRLSEAIDDLESRIKQIDQETHGLYPSIPVPTTSVGSAGWLPSDPLFGGYYGYVENIGRVGGAPSTFRLTKDGEIRYYLRSDKFDLGQFVGNRVWLNGNVELAAGATANVLNVEQIRILTEAEILAAGGQPGGLAQPYPAPQGGIDPYAQSYLPGQPAPMPSAPGSYQTVPPPAGVTGVSQLPDVVGSGQSFYTPTPVSGARSSGEVETDFFESPVISEIGP